MGEAPGEQADVAELREQLARVTEERDRLLEDVKVLQGRCEKLYKSAALQTPAEPKADAETQTDEEAASEPRPAADKAEPLAEAAGSRLPPAVERMLRSPRDEAVQLEGIDELFQQQTQVGGKGLGPDAALQGSLEAAVAIFGSHPGNHQLLLKTSQFLSLLLAEPNAQQQLPMAVLFQAAQAVSAVSVQLLADAAAAGSEGLSAQGKAGSPSPAKLLTWFLSLLALVLPGLGAKLRDRPASEQFVQELLGRVVAQLLGAAGPQQDALALKAAQVLPSLPPEPWVQEAFLESGVVHSLALARRRCADAPPDAPLPHALHAAARGAFSDNLDLCVKALEDMFVSEEFVCLLVLDELQAAEQRRRGTLRALDGSHGIVGKLLGLWAFHQQRALEDADPQKSPSREVLQRVAELLGAIVLKLQPQVLLQRMQEFDSSEVMQRVALAAIHANAQLRLQLAVNYAGNNVVAVVIGSVQMLLQRYEGPTVAAARGGDLEAALALLQGGQLPPDGWDYVLYGLEVCLHILSHWSATKISLKTKADVMDSSAAPLVLVQCGLVDVLVEIIDPAPAGFQLNSQPPSEVVQKATETLQALFEQNGHICLFSMQHYTEVKIMVAMGCECLAMDPLTEFPDMQKQAVEQLSASFEKFSVTDERLGRKVLKALMVLFESSYQLCAWYLQGHPLNALGEYQSLDVHAEAVRAVSRGPYWSAEDAPLLPGFVRMLAELLLGCIEGHDPEEASSTKLRGRVVDLTEAEEVCTACMTSALHLLLIDPSPPTVLESLAAGLGQGIALEESDRTANEKAVNAVMKVMRVFPSSDRVQMNCQHLLTSLLAA